MARRWWFRSSALATAACLLGVACFTMVQIRLLPAQAPHPTIAHSRQMRQLATPKLHMTPHFLARNAEQHPLETPAFDAELWVPDRLERPAWAHNDAHTLVAAKKRDCPRDMAAGRLGCLYENYDEAPFFDHWLDYADHYGTHFPPACVSDDATACPEVRLLEIGVQSGGSSRIWRQFYGPSLVYVGVDIDPASKRSEVAEEKTFVEIGSQADGDFLRSVCAKYGPFDAVVDDGGHTIGLITASLTALWPNDACLKEKAVYAVEDLHAMTYCMRKKECESPTEFRTLVGDLFASMHSFHSYGGMNQFPAKPNDIWGDRVKGIYLYDSLMFLQRGHASDLRRVRGGKDRIPYPSTAKTVKNVGDRDAPGLALPIVPRTDDLKAAGFDAAIAPDTAIA